MSVRRDGIIKRTLIHLILIVSAIIAVYPALRVFGISIRPDDILYSTSLEIIPDGATFSAYMQLIFEEPFLIWLKNSLIVSFFTVVLGVTLAATAGYAFAKKRFPGRKPGLIFFLIVQMFPSTMLLLPMFLLLRKINLTNSHLGLIIAYTTFVLPLCVWQMRGYYETIPDTLEEAALVDGLNQFQAFYKVILPLASPGLVITALFSFMSSWNEIMIAKALMQDPDMYTLPRGILNLSSRFNTEWSTFAAGSIMIMIPVVIMFLILSSYLVGGLTLGSVKG
ncbi:sugar ABC transporter permease [Halanaerobacter jeridensis]|uniref:Arabinogalactan oligomer/maltooligosaccharide transport system permease protein n=1 Tax=Halanaerobacter jeridensis TaxID=706427 RepID=A0A939BMR7_9FIRM|nr:sugar ABC transporter permease [Halanaerobacter jeridensis]MBM7557225.1 arabinogalactan oligomer/maltooligosaccharide transport system permease protein [Halanaerobacter jeridensis]